LCNAVIQTVWSTRCGIRRAAFPAGCQCSWLLAELQRAVIFAANFNIDAVRAGSLAVRSKAPAEMEFESNVTALLQCDFASRRLTFLQRPGAKAMPGKP
jgi:hypothetical protein